VTFNGEDAAHRVKPFAGLLRVGIGSECRHKPSGDSAPPLDILLAAAGTQAVE
jgi:hypothetical protein